MRRLLGVLIGLLVRLWLSTLRVRVHVDPELDLEDPLPLVLSFWHGQQQLLLAWKRRRSTLVMVSWSRDGELSSGAMAALGLQVVRGSSSRGGARALRELVRRIDGGHDAAFAVDGPRGPLREAKPGARYTARLAGARLVPLAASAERTAVLRGAWDRFELPLPFTRVAIALGAPLEPARTDEIGLELAIEAARAHAVAMLPRARVLSAGAGARST
jgi:hypothetical protein